VWRMAGRTSFLAGKPNNFCCCLPMRGASVRQWYDSTTSRSIRAAGFEAKAGTGEWSRRGGRAGPAARHPFPANWPEFATLPDGTSISPALACCGGGFFALGLRDDSTTSPSSFQAKEKRAGAENIGGVFCSAGSTSYKQQSADLPKRFSRAFASRGDEHDGICSYL
jgi:hypothetical protein